MTPQKNEPGRVIQFSKLSVKPSMLRCQLKTLGAETSKKRSLSSAVLSTGMIQERLVERLGKLDAEQLQIVEIIVIAIQRGVV